MHASLYHLRPNGIPGRFGSMFNIGLIGCGKMGGALLRGVVATIGKDKIQAALSDVIPQAVEALKGTLACKTSSGSPAEVAAVSDILILAVKPQDMQALCQSLAKVKGQRLCIVEAMKLMNEIESDTAGEIVKVFVENAQPVEYGQPLFGIRP